jgi:oxygen-independent coproporphyrinogen-3 oxidase
MKDLSIYIHIPFCKCICVYCAFLTFANKKGQIPDYIDTLIREIELRAPAYKSYRIESIYFGGGTPGLLEREKTAQILENIKKNYKVKKTAEISTECNPENISENKIGKYMEMGINRLTMGIQSLKKETLIRIARMHNEEMIKNSVDTLKKARFNNFGIDLIMGLPFQVAESFKRDIDKIISWKIPHISCYFLSDDTEKIKTFIDKCPSEDEQIKMYEYACRTLRGNGYIHYEVSNFAIPGYECRHNIRYWEQKEYLGLGLGAHSYIDNKIWVNTRDFNNYIENPLAIEEKLEHDPELIRMDYLMLNLRKKSGLNLNAYGQRFGQEEKEKLMLKSGKYIRNKKMVLNENNLCVSEKGFLLLDTITYDLI